MQDTQSIWDQIELDLLWGWYEYWTKFRFRNGERYEMLSRVEASLNAAKEHQYGTLLHDKLAELFKELNVD